MRDSTIGFILIVLTLLTVSCQSQETPPATTGAVSSPAPTPVLDVTFSTLTPGPGASPGPISPAQSTQPAPTATAEPVLYSVQAGDTLVDIAAANGLSLDELLSLNPNVQPELLMIGQQLILPPLPTAAATVAAPDGQAAALEIARLSTYSAAMGGVWVLGEVQNPGQQAVELVQVAVRLLDSADVELASETAWLTPATLPAGGAAPFGFLFPDVETAQTQAEAAVVAGRPVYDLGNRYLDLAVTDAEVTIGRSPIEVAGRLENQGERPADRISIITTFYDDQELVSGYHELVLDDPLLPGESVAFRFIALPPGGRVGGYAFATQAIVAD